VALGGGKARTLLGALLLQASGAVSSERLVDELWGARPPEAARKLVQGYVSGLRKLLGPDRLATRPPGYLVRLEAGELDLHEFERLGAAARVEQEPRRAAELWREALELWRGPALADLRFEGFAGREAERLNELRLAAPARAAKPRPARGTVTVLAAGLGGAAALGERLDPESLHAVLARYSEACAEVLERHGGTVERFVGNAVVAVFGLPSVHEDD